MPTKRARSAPSCAGVGEHGDDSPAGVKDGKRYRLQLPAGRVDDSVEGALLSLNGTSQLSVCWPVVSSVSVTDSTVSFGVFTVTVKENEGGSVDFFGLGGGLGAFFGLGGGLSPSSP